jgi:hypothetical protein
MPPRTASLTPIDELDQFGIHKTQDELDVFSIPDTQVHYLTIDVWPAHQVSSQQDLSITCGTRSNSTGIDVFAIADTSKVFGSPTSTFASPSTEADLFDIPNTPDRLSIPPQDVQSAHFSFPSQLDVDLDFYRIPDSPVIPPVDLMACRIPDSATIVPSHSMSVQQPEDPLQMLDTEVFNISDSPPLTPMADLMDLCDIPNSPPAEVHPEAQNSVVDTGPSNVDSRDLGRNTAEGQSLKTMSKNLVPYLPIILSRASLLRAQLAQVIMERDFVRGQIDMGVTRIAEVDRYLYGLRALQLMRQSTEEHGGEEGEM